MTAEIFHTTKWLKFRVRDRGVKTVKIEVINTSGQYIGLIKWHGPWRQYTFIPTRAADLILNDGCIQGIADVLGLLRRDRLAEGHD